MRFNMGRRVALRLLLIGLLPECGFTQLEWRGFSVFALWTNVLFSFSEME